MKLPTVKPFLLFAVLITNIGLCWSESDHCYCVEPQHAAPPAAGPINPCNSSCHTLRHYASQNISENNTSWYFLPGTHSLGALYGIEDLHDLKFIAYGIGDGASGCGISGLETATVECEGNQAGFYFRNIERLAIFGLTFKNCGYYTDNKFRNAIVFRYVWYLSVTAVSICNTSGVGIYGYEIIGDSIISHSIINSSRRAPYYSSSSSGNLHFYYEYKNANKTHHHYLTIVDSEIINGENSPYIRSHAGGLFLYLRTTNAIHFLLSNVTMSGNSGYNGGNAAFDYIAIGSSWLSTITIQSCRFDKGSADGFGAGLYAVFIALYDEKYRVKNNMSTDTTGIMNVSDSYFEDNSAGRVGAGIYIRLHESSKFEAVAHISFTDCHFQNNHILSTTGRGGSAVNIINFRIPDYIPHHLPQYIVSFEACNFTGNRAVKINKVSLGSSALYVEENAYMILSNCVFRDNHNCSGLSAIHSNLMLKGTIEIYNNTAVNGGGIVLCANSILHFTHNMTLTISGNKATRDGGGIFNEDDCLQAIPPCFFQVDNTTNLNKTVFLVDNTADRAGSSIFGGSVNHCYYYGSAYSSDESKRHVFEELFQIASLNPNDTSNISSNPIRVCFCEGGSGEEYYCSQRSKHYPVFSGGELKVTVVVVGQRNGTVPGIVVAQVHTNVSLRLNEQNQLINTTKCTNLTYTVQPKEPVKVASNTTIVLTTENNFRNTSEGDTSIYIHVTVHPCPPGFHANENGRVCECSDELKNLQDISCKITNTAIERKEDSPWWVGFDGKNHVIYHRNCPFDYCVKTPVDINVTMPSTQDRQCTNGRTGVICGVCKPGLSIVLGSTHCHNCSHYSVWWTLGKILLFAIQGVALILCIGVLNLNVTEGTLNAFIFYMNVVKFNTSYFDTSRYGSAPANWINVLVAWIDFDKVIDGCFYDGMTEIGKTSLGCTAPLYMWFLAGLIIYLGRKYSWVVKIFGTDTVKVLATIILYSYAKLISSLIAIFSPTLIKSTGNNGDKFVWTINGKAYLHDKEHLVLLVCGLVLAAVTLPFTFTLLFIQCLRSRSNMKVLFWVNKLKPFFDAYTGPYKDKYHFWTGFLLVVRIVLFVCIAATGSPMANLTLIIATSSFLLFFMQQGIYKSRALNIIETFSLLNLIVFTALTSYLKFKNEVPVMFCVGSMFLLFCGIVVYHILKKLSVTRRWGLMKVWLLDRRWPWMKKKQIRSLILPYVDPDNDEDLSSSDSELDPILQNAPPVARYDQYREPLIGTTRTE